MDERIPRIILEPGKVQRNSNTLGYFYEGHEILHEIYTSKRSKLNALNTRYPYYTRIYRHTSLTEFNKRA